MVSVSPDDIVLEVVSHSYKVVTPDGVGVGVDVTAGVGVGVNVAAGVGVGVDVTAGVGVGVDVTAGVGVGVDVTAGSESGWTLRPVSGSALRSEGR